MSGSCLVDQGHDILGATLKASLFSSDLPTRRSHSISTEGFMVAHPFLRDVTGKKAYGSGKDPLVLWIASIN